MKNNFVRLTLVFLFLAVCAHSLAGNNKAAPLICSESACVLQDGTVPYPPLCPNGPCRLSLLDGGVPYPPICPDGPCIIGLRDGGLPYPPLCPNGPCEVAYK